MTPDEIKQLMADLMLGFCGQHYQSTRLTADGVRDAVKVDADKRISIDEKGGGANLDMNDPVVVVGLSILSGIIYDLMKLATIKAHTAWFKKPTEDLVKDKTAAYRDEELKAIARKMVQFLREEQGESLKARFDRLAPAAATSSAPAAAKADIIATLDAECGAKIKDKKPDAIDPYIVVDAADLPAVCRTLRDHPNLKFDILNCISGVDYLELDPKKIAKAGFEPHLEVVYHLSSFAHKHRMVVKVLLPRWKDDKPGELPEVPSVVDVWPAADWHERETFDLAGVMFTGHPGLHRILLADDWVGHPLRKDYEFPLEYHGIRGR